MVNFGTGAQRLLVDGEFGWQLCQVLTVKWTKEVMRAELRVRLEWERIGLGCVLLHLYPPVAVKLAQARLDMLLGGWLIVMKASAACAVAE